MSIALQIIPLNHGTVAEPCSATTNDQVGEKKAGNTSREAFCCGHQIKLSKVSSQCQRSSASYTKTSACALLQVGNGDPTSLSYHALRLGGLAKKHNFSKYNRKIAGNGGGGVCQKTVCRLRSFNCRTFLPV